MNGASRPVTALRGCWSGAHDADPDSGRCRTCDEPATPYDGWADWYESRLRDVQPEMLADVVALLLTLVPADRDGSDAVDLCCGPGLVSAHLVADEWDVIGVDASAAMCELARERVIEVRHAPVDSTGLPAGSFELVISTLSHTDAPWPRVVAEAHRLLRPGKPFVYVGTHPAFIGPHARRGAGGLLMYPGRYGDNEFRRSAPGYATDGLREKVGARHLSLAQLFEPLMDGWEAPTIMEGKLMPFPWHLGFRAVKA